MPLCEQMIAETAQVFNNTPSIGWNISLVMAALFVGFMVGYYKGRKPPEMPYNEIKPLPDDNP